MYDPHHSVTTLNIPSVCHAKNCAMSARFEVHWRLTSFNGTPVLANRPSCDYHTWMFCNKFHLDIPTVGHLPLIDLVVQATRRADKLKRRVFIWQNGDKLFMLPKNISPFTSFQLVYTVEPRK